jgi:hypothetical protein
MTNTQKPNVPTPAVVATNRIKRLVADAQRPAYTSEAKR